MPSALSSNELWGTFAVDDHLRRRAYVAETILFDRVVIPLPPKGDEAEHRDWVRAGWQPDRLLEIRKRLGPLAIAVPWSGELREEWRAEYSSSTGRRAIQAKLGNDAAADVRIVKSAGAVADPKYLTRSVLARRIATPVDEITDAELVREIQALDVDPAADIEVVVGYGSLARYRADVATTALTSATASIADLDQARSTEAGPATLFVTWNFLVPEDSTLSDADLLLRAVSLSTKDEFREARRRFHEWRRNLALNGVAVAQARTEMNRCLAVCNEITVKERRRTRCLTALQAVAAFAPLGDLAYPGIGLSAGIVLSVASMVADKAVPHYKVGERASVATLVHDSREAFGWRARA